MNINNYVKYPLKNGIKNFDELCNVNFNSDKENFKTIVLTILDQINNYYESLPLYNGRYNAETTLYKYEKLRMLTDGEIRHIYHRFPKRYKNMLIYWALFYGYDKTRVNINNRKKFKRYKEKHNPRRALIQILQNEYFPNIRLMDLGRIRGNRENLMEHVIEERYKWSINGVSPSPVF